MQFDMCLAEMVGVNEPVVSTETGYASGVGLSDAIIGRYELRITFRKPQPRYRQDIFIRAHRRSIKS